MTNKDYHADVSRISKSGLDLISRSPLHYWSKYLDPNREPEKSTPALVIGSALHSWVLEEHQFPNEFVVPPSVDRRTSAGKETWAAFEAASAGRTLITSEQFDMIRRMKDAIMKHPAASNLLQGGIAESTIHWSDESTGVACKCRPDYRRFSKIIVDVKTTEDASPDSFARSALKYRYDVQAAFYLDGANAAANEELYEAFVFIAVEKSPPYGVAVYFSPHEFVNLGRQKYQADLATYARCISTNVWPGYSNEIQELPVPAYAFKKEDL